MSSGICISDTVRKAMILDEIKNRHEVIWINPGLNGGKNYSIGMDIVRDHPLYPAGVLED